MNKMNRINVCISSSLICLILLLDIHENSPVECRALEKSAKLNKAEANKALMVSKEAVDKRLKEPDVLAYRYKHYYCRQCVLCARETTTPAVKVWNAFHDRSNILAYL